MTQNMTENVFAPPRAELETRTGPDALWEMPFKELRNLYYASVNIHALGVLYGLGAVGMVAAAGMFLAGASGTTSAAPAPWIVVFMAGSGLLSVAACVSAYTRPTWGRWIGFVLCALSLFNFPFGTLIGALGLVAYARGARLFGPERIVPAELKEVFKQRKKDKK